MESNQGNERAGTPALPPTAIAAKTPTRSASTRARTLFRQDSEMGVEMARFDWAKSSLGPVRTWPQSLRTAVSICLASRFPILLWWGPDLVMLYNDAYRQILGAKHPASLGAAGKQVWPEIWHIIGPMLEGVLNDGVATWSDDQLLPLERNGYAEECYFTFSYSPIQDESGGVGGVFCAVTETTARVLAERRMKTARDMATAIVDARTTDEVCERAMGALASDPADVPFAGLYLVSTEQREAHLITCAPSQNASDLTSDQDLPSTALDLPRTIPLASKVAVEDGDALAQVVARVARTGQMERMAIPHTGGDARATTGEAARSVPEAMVILPVSEPGRSQVSAVLVSGVNPMRALDDDYQNFYDLLVSHLSAGLAAASAYEEERRRAEALAEIDRAKTTFFSNVSHEFRTPLTLILGPLEDLLANPALGSDERAHLRLVHRNSLRLLRLVNTLLDFSRIEAGRAQAAYVPTDLASCTAEIASGFRSLVEHAGLRFVVDCPPLPDLAEPVYVDRVMWEKVVLNLLSNAFKFTFVGEVAVGLRSIEHGRGVALTVRDSGTGITPDNLPRIFERFHRIQGARSRSYEGSGIGLALVQELVHLHGGSITASSQVDQGTTITVTLPVGSAHLPTPQVHTEATEQAEGTLALETVSFVEEARRWLPTTTTATSVTGEEESDGWLREEGVSAQPLLPLSVPARADGTRPRILLADDNADLQEYLRRLLRDLYEVEVVADGAAALAAARAHVPDLVLSDVMMPTLDGFELLRALRSDPMTRTVPVLLLSARAGEEATIEGLEAGADDYLIKPFSAREVLARVATHLEMARLRQEALARARELETTFEAMTDGVVVYGAAGELRLMNTAYRAMIGLDEQELARPLEERGRTLMITDPATGEILPPAFWPAMRLLRGEMLTGSQSVDVLIHAGDGREVLMNCAGAPVRTASGQVAGAVMVVRDVGEHRRLERISAEHAAQLSTLFQAMPDAAALFNAEGQLLVVNTAFRTLFALDLDAYPDFFTRSVEERREILRLRDTEGHPLPPEKSPFERVVRRGEEIIGGDAMDVLAEHPSGDLIEMEVVGSPIRAGDGANFGGVLLYRDVTERRRLERRTRTALDALLATAHELVATDVGAHASTGLRGVAGRLARLARQVLGCEMISLCGVDVETGLFIPLATLGRAPTYEAEWYKTIAQHRPDDYYDADQLARLRDGETIVLDVPATISRALPMYGTRATAIAPLSSHGRIEGILSAAYATADHQYSEDELALATAFAQMAHLVLQRERLLGEREAERSKAIALVETTRRMDEFLGISSHELRTPLTSISANIQLANKNLKTLSEHVEAEVAHDHGYTSSPDLMAFLTDARSRAERAHMLLDRTERQLVRMDRLVGDLLDVARIQAGKLEFVMEPCDLLDIVREATSEQRATWADRAITLDLPPDAAISLRADGDRIGQVVTNFLTNALKYSPVETAVAVSVRVTEGWARVAVRDEGPGLSREQQEHLFERFFRVPGIQRQSGSGVGLGLGLHICKTIAERHGGTVGVESAPGHGSTFWFTVPVAR